MNSEQSVEVQGGGTLEQATKEASLGELVDEIVTAARLLLLNIHIEPFETAGVSVVVTGRKAIR